jgi:predicted ATPase
LDGTLVRLGTFQDALFEGATDERIGFELVANGSNGDVRLCWNFVFASTGSRLSEKGIHLPEAIVPRSIFGPGFRFLSAERVGPRLNYAMADRDLSAVGLGIQGEWTAEFLAANKDRHIEFRACQHPGAIPGRLLNQIEAWMSEFSPGLRIEVEADPARDAVSVRYRFEARRGISNSYRTTNVGFGISYALPVIVAVLTANPGDVILLEGPEAHLHPRGQSKLGELLARAAIDGVQVIAETHSDHVINGVRVAVHQNLIPAPSAEFLYFNWDPRVEDGATTVQRLVMDEHGRIEDWPEGFFDEMDRSLEILLTPKPT